MHERKRGEPVLAECLGIEQAVGVRIFERLVRLRLQFERRVRKLADGVKCYAVGDILRQASPPLRTFRRALLLLLLRGRLLLLLLLSGSLTAAGVVLLLSRLVPSVVCTATACTTTTTTTTTSAAAAAAATDTATAVCACTCRRCGQRQGCEVRDDVSIATMSTMTPNLTMNPLMGCLSTSQAGGGWPVVTTTMTTTTTTTTTTTGTTMTTMGCRCRPSERRGGTGVRRHLSHMPMWKNG